MLASDFAFPSNEPRIYPCILGLWHQHSLPIDVHHDAIAAYGFHDTAAQQRASAYALAIDNGETLGGILAVDMHAELQRR